MMSHCIVKMTHTTLSIIGPFGTNEQAADYGAYMEDREWDGDPRWQTIELTLPDSLRYLTQVFTPKQSDIDAAKGSYPRFRTAGAPS